MYRLSLENELVAVQKEYERARAEAENLHNNRPIPPLNEFRGILGRLL